MENLKTGRCGSSIKNSVQCTCWRESKTAGHQIVVVKND